jgi:hypothetical protein
MGEDYASDVSSVRDGTHWCIYCNIKTLNTLWLTLNERHWRQSEAIPDVYGHKRLLEKERLASLSMLYQHRIMYFNFLDCPLDLVVR